MRVGWLADAGNEDGLLGGAEFTQAEFKAAAPEGVDVVPVPPHDLGWLDGCDTVCVFNCVRYPDETDAHLAGKKVVRYWSDVAPHGSKQLTRWLLSHATNVFCSPLHYDRFPWRNGNDLTHEVIPPPVDLGPFRQAAEAHQGDKRNACSVAAWRGWGKTPHLTNLWGISNGGVDFYGPGALAPAGSQLVPYDQMPQVLAAYQRFVYLPTMLEPFCRLAVEAWAAGCELVVNRLVGATHFIENDQPALESAAQDFWRLVLN